VLGRALDSPNLGDSLSTPPVRVDFPCVCHNEMSDLFLLRMNSPIHEGVARDLRKALFRRRTESGHLGMPPTSSIFFLPALLRSIFFSKAVATRSSSPPMRRSFLRTIFNVKYLHFLYATCCFRGGSTLWLQGFLTSPLILYSQLTDLVFPASPSTPLKRYAIRSVTIFPSLERVTREWTLRFSSFVITMP